MRGRVARDGTGRDVKWKWECNSNVNDDGGGKLGDNYLWQVQAANRQGRKMCAGGQGAREDTAGTCSPMQLPFGYGKRVRCSMPELDRLSGLPS